MFFAGSAHTYEHTRQLYQHDVKDLASEYIGDAADQIGTFFGQALSEAQQQMVVSLIVSSTSLLRAQIQQVEATVDQMATTFGGRLASLESLVGASAVADVSLIDWEQVLLITRDVADAHGWKALIVADETNGRVEVELPADQEDLLVRTSLDFYAALSERLGDLFRHISFELSAVASDDE